MRLLVVCALLVVFIHPSQCLSIKSLRASLTKHSSSKPFTFICGPGYWDAHTGLGLFCSECGYGFFCQDGEQIACPGGTTTSSNTASSAGECVSTQPPDQPMTGPVGNPLNPTEPPGLNPSPPQTPPQDAPANPEPSSPAPSPPRPPVLTPVPASKCNPCADANPDVLMTTGAAAEPPNSLWRIRNWSPRMNLVPEFLCTLTGMDSMAGDIAISSTGDVMIVDLACNIYVLDYTAYQQLVPTTNRTTQCTPTFVARLGVAPGTTCTGLSSGLRSNHLLLSTNQGEVVVMEVEARPDGTFGSTVRSQVDVALDPLSGKQGSSGGTDVTMSPDGYFYRWSAKDDEAEYTATRFDIAPDTGLLGGKHSYTNRGLSDDTHKYTSAGTFCTSEYLVGVAARSHASAVNHATFFIYGVEPSDDQVTPADLPIMELVAQSVTTEWETAMRVNGAAVRPVCGL